ncbi:MAG: hypothetical protein ACRDG3_05265 [Tepidiformaceae bacterium]
MSDSLKGRVVAIVGAGSARDRAVAVALAEAGADIAIATERPLQVQEFATASIANEVWALGREQFSAVIDASDGAQLDGFLGDVRSRLGRLDAVVGATVVVAGAAPLAITLVDAPDDAAIGDREVSTAGRSDDEVAQAVLALLGS